MARAPGITFAAVFRLTMRSMHGCVEIGDGLSLSHAYPTTIPHGMWIVGIGIGCTVLIPTPIPPVPEIHNNGHK